MIEVNPDTACVLYLGVAILTVIGVWFFQHKRAKKKEILTFNTTHFTCEFCYAKYLEDPTKVLTRCPECHSLNKNVKKQKQ